MIQTRRSSHSRRQRQEAKDRHVRKQRRNLHAEQLEARMLLAANPFHNGFWPADVDNSLKVTAADVLHIVNELNHSGSYELVTEGETLPEMADVPYYTDVSGDGSLTPLDALQVVNTINGGEGEIAPSDVVRFRLELRDSSGNVKTTNTASVGETFQLWGYVQDVRFQTGTDPGSTTMGLPTGAFAAYLDVLTTNADLVEIRYGETQDLKMDATHPAGVYPLGTFTLTFKGQTTTPIAYQATDAVDALAIKQALEALSTIGAGNVEVTTLQGGDFDGRFFIRFKGALGEQDVPQITVQATGMQGSYQDVNDDDKDGDKTEYLTFTPQPIIVDNYIPVNPTNDEQAKNLFRSSFSFTDPYVNGPSAVNEVEAGQPAGSSTWGEIGAFLNRFDLNSGGYTPRQEYHLFSVDIQAVAPGQIQISGNAAETNKTLVFSLPGGGGSKTEVDPANIGFYQDQTLDPADPNTRAPLTVTITAPITVNDDPIAVNEDSGTTSIPVLGNDVVDAGSGGVAPLSLVPGSLSAIDPAQGSATISGTSVNFTPASNFSGQVTFTYQAKDAATPAHTGTGTVTVTVAAVNDLPTVNAIANLNLNEDPGEQTVNLTGITAGGGETQPLQVTAVSSNQTLIPGVTIGYTSPNNTGTLKFTPAANQSGTAVVTVTVTDGGLDANLGTAGDNGTFSRSFTVTVAALNDPPVNTVPGPQAVANNAPFVFSAANGNGISTMDPDGNVNIVTDLTVAVTANLTVAPGTLAVKQGGGATITALTPTSPNVAPVGLRIAGTVSQVQDALSQITYTPPVLPSPGFVNTVTLVVDTNDQGNIGAPGPITDHDEITLNVIPPRQPFAAADSATVAEDSENNTIDVLSNDIPTTGGTLTITQLNGQNVALQPIVTTHGSVTTNGTTVSYTPADDYFGNDTFTYQITDSNGGEGPHTGTVAVTVTPVNDGPDLTIPFAQITTAEETQTPVSNGGSITVTDIDADAGGGLQVTLSVSHGTLNAPNGTVTITGANSPTLTINGLVAAVNTSLAGLTYKPAQDYSGSDTLQVAVDDLGHTGGGSLTDSGSVTLNVTPVNDRPTITAPTTEVVTAENTPVVFAASGANKIAVADVDNTTLTVNLTATNGVLKLQTTSGLTFNSGADNSAAMNFTGAVTNIDAALNGMSYSPAQNYVGSATLGITVNDGQLDAQQNVNIFVSGVNNAPVNNLPATAQTNEDTPLAFTGANLISIQDVDAGTQNVQVNVAVTNGVFTLNPAANLTGLTVSGNGSAAVSIEGPLAGINGALSGSTYTPTLNFNTNDTGVKPTLTLATNDNGNTGTGGAKTDTDTMTITVNSVNDPPIANDDGSPTNRFTVLWNSTNNPFDVLPNDNTGPDVGETLTITNVDTSNAHGTVTIQGGQLLYSPAPGYVGGVEIVYTINDRANGSGLTDTATVYITVVDFVSSDVSGHVYFDFNNNGVKDDGEWGIGGVRMSLTGTNAQGNPVNLTAWTDGMGFYKFDDVMPCQAGTAYLLSQQQPSTMIDGQETIGDQGGTMAANDQMRISLPLFGYADGIFGMHNNFAELGFRAEFAGLTLWDLVHAGGDGEAGDAGGLLIGTDAAGNVQCYINLGGWTGYIPGQQLPANPNAFTLTTQNGKLPLTDARAAKVREINATDAAIRSIYSRTGERMLRISGAADDFGLPLYQTAAVAGGEGEGISETSDAEQLAAAGSYEAAVDAVLAGVA